MMQDALIYKIYAPCQDIYHCCSPQVSTVSSSLTPDRYLQTVVYLLLDLTLTCPITPSPKVPRRARLLRLRVGFLAAKTPKPGLVLSYLTSSKLHRRLPSNSIGLSTADSSHTMWNVSIEVGLLVLQLQESILRFRMISWSRSNGKETP